MALLKQRGAELGAPSQASSVMVKSTPATQLLLGNTPQANNFTLVDGLTQVMGAPPPYLARQVMTTFA